jgi:small-conductance mechanosensitive channel
MGVVLGMMSAGIGFALQEVIGSFAGWLSILAGRSISVGDRVEMGGIKGDVIDIGVLRTSLMEVGAWMTGEHYTGRIVLVSNAAIFKEPLFNYTKDFSILWDEIKFTLPLTADWRKARILMEEAGRQRVQEFVERGREAVKRMGERYLFEFQMVEPNTVIAPGVGQLSGTVDVILRYTTDPRQRRRIKDDIIGAIMERFAAEGINPGVPVTQFQMTPADGELRPTFAAGPGSTHLDDT